MTSGRFFSLDAGLPPPGKLGTLAVAEVAAQIVRSNLFTGALLPNGEVLTAGGASPRSFRNVSKGGLPRTIRIVV